MTSSIVLPVWLFAVIAVLAAITIANFLFLPGLRWLLRRRVNQVIEEVNDRLRVKLPILQLSNRDALIDRLAHDREVMKAVETEAAKRGVTRFALLTDVSRYAAEMVPAFNAYFYFRLGYWMARGFLRSLYRVRLGFAHEAALAPVEPNTAVVFFINHRSNMDYMLVTYLASRSAALSYGAGEWCRVWPFRSVLRLAGAYIVRRNTADPLYRKVLERYVQIATESGVPHAIFGEGQLSRNGKVNAPKLGLLGYIIKTFRTEGDFDVMLVPVATNFDRVVEEQTLVANADTDFRGRGTAFVLASSVGFVLRQIWHKLTGKWHGFGIACANFGEPVSLRAWSRERNIDMSGLDRDQFFATVSQLGDEMTERVVAVMPVLAVPALAVVLLDADGPVKAEELCARTCAFLEELRLAGAHVLVDRQNEQAAIEEAIKLLQLCGLVARQPDGTVAPVATETPRLRYYANSVDQVREQIAGKALAK